MPMASGAAPPAVPDGWRVVRLGEVCDGARYGASAPARPFDPDLPRYVRITDISDAGRLRADDPRSADPERVQGYELHPGDLLFARSGSVGRTYLYQPEDGPCVFAGYLIRFRPNPDVVLPRFVDLYTHSPAYYRWVESVLHAGAQPNINAAEYGSLPILLPPLAEQRGIAAVLDAIDEAIERSEAVIAATEELRRSLLHELLSRGVPGRHSEWREVRGLGVVPACWEVVRLGEVLALDQPGAWGDEPTASDPGVRVLRAADLTRDGRVNPETAAWRRLSARDRERRLMQDGDLILERSGGGPGTPVGRVALIDGFGPVYCNNFCQQLRVDDARCSPRYAARALWHRYARGVTARLEHQTTGIRNLDYAGYLAFPIALPPPAEQQAITNALDGVDASLEESRMGTDVLRSVKASASEALLSGRVRVARQR